MLPELIKHPHNLSVDSYEIISFECKAKLYGDVQIHWEKVGSSTLPGAATVTVTRSQDDITSVLKITNIISYYKGDYFCVVKNEIGKVQSSKARLHVNGKAI